MRKTQLGIIVSDKMTNTAVVAVSLWRIHPILKKRFQRHRKFMAQNPNNEYKMGETVEIAETKPLSRHKRWEITKRIEKTK
ncbi:MAG TPA: 30S ribosomal protein S17 [Candidatus Saccharimonadales bacterium]|nr:30S ribosomal protein S17 [Candidatus Saccharimonadales bacterium]